MKKFQVELGTHFNDARGVIQNLLDKSVNAIAIITSKAGSVRSNHMHLKNDHYLYIVSGEMEYYERDPEEDGSIIQPIVFTTGEMIYTPPGKVHKTVFLKDTVMLSFGKERRTHDLHEEDLIRIEF